MIRRNLLGQFFSIAILICLVVIIVAIARTFSFSTDWIEGPTMAGRSLYLVQTFVVIIAVIVAIISFIGQFVSRAEKYSGFAVFLLFCTWMATGMMLLVSFFEVIFDPVIDDFGALQQVVVVTLGLGVFAITWLYSVIKFPEYKDVEYIKSVIEKEVDRAVYKPDLSCEKCGEGLKDDWEFCPNCGGMMVGEDDIVLTDYEVIIEDEPKFAPPSPRKKRGLFGRRKDKMVEPKDEFVIDDDEPELEAEPEGDVPPDEDFIDEFDKKAAEKKPAKKEKKKEKKASGVTRVKCDKCSTLLEIRNPKRPLHVRCPDCKNIWELKD